MARPRDLQNEEDRRREILLAARWLLSTGSHAAVTMQRIAAHANVSKGMLSYYWRNKDELITAAIELHFEQQEQMLRLIVEDDSLTVRERLERLLYVAIPDRELAVHGMQFLVEAFSYAKTRPEAHALLVAAYKRFRKAGEHLLEIGAREGYVRDEDHTWTNLALNALIDGLAFQIAVDDELEPAEIRARVMAVIDHLVGADS